MSFKNVKRKLYNIGERKELGKRSTLERYTTQGIVHTLWYDTQHFFRRNCVYCCCQLSDKKSSDSSTFHNRHSHSLSFYVRPRLSLSIYLSHSLSLSLYLYLPLSLTLSLFNHLYLSVLYSIFVFTFYSSLTLYLTPWFEEEKFCLVLTLSLNEASLCCPPVNHDIQLNNILNLDIYICNIYSYVCLSIHLSSEHLTANLHVL